MPSASIPDSLPKGQNYILVEEAATADGVAQFENQLNRSYEYYLVETKAPEGYIRPNGYYHVSIDTKDLYTKTIDNTDPFTSEQKWPVTDPMTLSNWEQSSKVLVSGSDSEASANVIYGESGDGTGYNYDSTADARVIYRIRNEVGVELPYTGGIGTKVFTLPGICLMAFAAAMLGYKKKKSASGNCSGRRGGDSL